MTTQAPAAVKLTVAQYNATPGMFRRTSGGTYHVKMNGQWCPVIFIK